MHLLRCLIVLAVCSLLTPAAALAWNGGPRNGEGFGTQDWIVTAGNRMAVSQGCVWLDLSVAASATAEPDRIPGDLPNHAFDRWGKRYGSSPTKVAKLYAQAVRSYRAGDRIAASHTVGLLSHYFADTTDPLNTDDSKAEKRMRGRYERAVDRILRSPSASRSWPVYDGYKHVTNASATTASAATAAHASYSTLVREYNRHGMSKKSLSIAKRQTVRAANGVADLIMSIEQDAIEVSTSPKVYAHQGVAVGEGYRYVFNTTLIRRLYPSWVTTGTNLSPVAGVWGFDDSHLGAGCYRDGKLYVPAENWPNVSNQHLLVFDATTLERIGATPTGQTHEMAAVCVAPGSGGGDSLWVASYFDSTKLFEYALDDGHFIGQLPLSPAPKTGIQGLAYRDGSFYLATGLPKNHGYLYSATPAGQTKLLYVRHATGTHEGIAWDGSTLLWLVDKGTPGSYVYSLRLPDFLATLR